MSKHRRIIVSAVLVLLLIAALANFLFIRRLSTEDAAANSAAAGTQEVQGASAPFSGARPFPHAVGPRFINPAEYPAWYGRASLSKSATGYDIIIEAVQRGSRQNYSKLDAVEAELRQAGQEAHGTTLLLKNSGDGRFLSHVDTLGAGDWEVHVRMHRETTTLEFTQKFTVD